MRTTFAIILSFAFHTVLHCQIPRDPGIKTFIGSDDNVIQNIDTLVEYYYINDSNFCLGIIDTYPKPKTSLSLFGGFNHRILFEQNDEKMVVDFINPGYATSVPLPIMYIDTLKFMPGYFIVDFKEVLDNENIYKNPHNERGININKKTKKLFQQKDYNKSEIEKLLVKCSSNLYMDSAQPITIDTVKNTKLSHFPIIDTVQKMVIKPGLSYSPVIAIKVVNNKKRTFKSVAPITSEALFIIGDTHFFVRYLIGGGYTPTSSDKFCFSQGGKKMLLELDGIPNRYNSYIDSVTFKKGKVKVSVAQRSKRPPKYVFYQDSTRVKIKNIFEGYYYMDDKFKLTTESANNLINEVMKQEFCKLKVEKK